MSPNSCLTYAPVRSFYPILPSSFSFRHVSDVDSHHACHHGKSNPEHIHTQLVGSVSMISSVWDLTNDKKNPLKYLLWKIMCGNNQSHFVLGSFFRRPKYHLLLKNCIISTCEIQIYGQYSKKPPTTIVSNTNGVSIPARIQIVLCSGQPDLLIRSRDVRYSPGDC